MVYTIINKQYYFGQGTERVGMYDVVVLILFSSYFYVYFYYYDTIKNYCIYILLYCILFFY